jgi:hypothetical protein
VITVCQLLQRHRPALTYTQILRPTPTYGSSSRANMYIIHESQVVPFIANLKDIIFIGSVRILDLMLLITPNNSRNNANLTNPIQASSRAPSCGVVSDSYPIQFLNDLVHRHSRCPEPLLSVSPLLLPTPCQFFWNASLPAPLLEYPLLTSTDETRSEKNPILDIPMFQSCQGPARSPKARS